MRLYYLSHSPEKKKHTDGYYIIGNSIFDIKNEKVEIAYSVEGNSPEEKIEYLKKYSDEDIDFNRVFYYDDAGEFDERVIDIAHILTKTPYYKLLKEDLDLM
ncbi:MAG: hypothetical protein IKG42_02410 [Clostridia bacterium]|nr:hypothetical protein [Clostridia bacterium]